MNLDMQDLKELIEFASATVEKIFRETGAVRPMYHAIGKDGQPLVMLPAPGDDDESVALMKAQLKLRDVDRYVYMGEDLMLDIRQGTPVDPDQLARIGLRNHPDRREIVVFVAENVRGEHATGRRFILRPEHGRPVLSPLEIDELIDQETLGRMAGML